MNHIRQGQNNNSKRSRGRGRKPQNSGNRAYDSNGPDVKIRGTATHVCEKYQQLARDAITSGDRVMAENYYQHAEHYYRLIMAAQAPNDGQPRPQNSLGYRPDEDQDYDDDDMSNDPAQPQSANQPYHQQNNNNNNNNGGGERRNNNNNGNSRNGGQRQNRNQRNNGGDAANAQANGNSDEEASSEAQPQPQPQQPPQPQIEAPVVEAVQPVPVVVEGDAPVAATEEAPRRRAPRRRRPRADATASGDGDVAPEAGGGSDEVSV